MEARLVVKMEAGVDLKFYVVSYFIFTALLYQNCFEEHYLISILCANKICLKKLACLFKLY